MTSNVWIKLLAYEACVRHVADRRRSARIAKSRAAMESRVLAHLRCAVAVDLEDFLSTVGSEWRAVLTCRDSPSSHGFVVLRTDDLTRTQTLAVDLSESMLSCRYDGPDRSLHGVSNPRLLTIEIGDDGPTLSHWNEGLRRTFPSVDALSAFLLAPILGRDPSDPLDSMSAGVLLTRSASSRS